LKSLKQVIFGIGSALSVLTLAWGADKPAIFESATAPTIALVDSDTLKYPFHDRITDTYSDPGDHSPLYGKDPSNIKTEVQYDPDNNRYNITENMGELFYRNPNYLTFDEFIERQYKKTTKDYFKQRAGEDDALNKKTFAPKITINSVVFDRIFGGNVIDIRPQGSAELSFGVNINKSENPAIPIRQRTVTTFDFKEKIQMNVIANIGDKMKLTTNYNTEATFDFENKMKIEYTGYEDDIIKKIEAGNITMPLPTQLITGSQSLFGIKTQLQFGKMNVTAVFSQQKSESKSIKVQGGAQTTNFEIKADQYEELRHFFLGQYFAQTYDQNLSDLNRISSAINITKIEVWVTSKQTISQNNQNRNIFAFADLGETAPDPSQTFVTGNGAGNVPPTDLANNLFAQLGTYGIANFRDIANESLLNGVAATGYANKKNYETVENARLLQATEYTLNSRLGYISLNTKLKSNEVLAVAYEYTINGTPYRVGELTSSSNGNVSGTQALFVKLIHSSNFSPKVYTWDLMMKNIYSLGGFNISPEKFRLDVLYQDDRIGGNINYISDGCADVKSVPLIKLLNLDDLNTNRDPQPDGVFDFVPGITINPQTGRIIFPVREPFGSYLASKFCNDQTKIDKYAYLALYDSTKTSAQQQPEKNKFSLKGTYQSSSGSEIPLNAVNIPQGSVKVTAGGITLTENVDYTVDYTLGRVKILNESYLKSNTPLDVKLESNSLFSLQTKTILGTRLEYNFNKDLMVGGTFMHLYERPLTQKVNIGDEPVSNTIWGVDGNYRRESRFLTKLLDKLPFYSTREVSTLTFNGEFAQMIPGHSSAIGSSGTSYVDDFEGAITPLDMKTPGMWFLSSIPEGQTELSMFPEAVPPVGDSLAAGKNRAKISWYYIDPSFQRTQSGITPSNITTDDESNNFVREIPQAEIFPNKSSPYGPQTITCMNVAFYPNERGPYNFDVDPSVYSKGLKADGTLESPETRWGGIMRKIETTDFESNNVEFIQFWMMDPFATGSPNDNTGGELYFNLGSISEDILKDNHKSFENGLPAPGTNNYTVDSTQWGYYPTIQSIVPAFDNDPTSRAQQDVGLDGLSNSNEQRYFANYLNRIATVYNPNSPAYTQAADDPAADDYKWFLASDYETDNIKPLERYKNWNGTEGNSQSTGNQVSQSTNQPDQEDINKDNNMNTGENYYQYKIVLKPGNMVVGQNYITDEITANNISLANNTTGSVKWYQFKIPIKSPDRTIGTPELTTIEFIRMVMKNFQKPIICRFAKLELLRGEWRRYNFSLLTPGEYSPTPEVPGGTTFDITSVSIEENGSRTPVNYVIPPGIEKEKDLSAPALATLNEQSLSLKVCDLEDGDARAAYRNTQFDFRAYKKLKMFIHAESNPNTTALSNGEMHAFMRIGSDFNDNYYEYDIPLNITPPNTQNANEIWPDANIMEIDLDKLIAAKLARNAAMVTNGGTVTLLSPYKYSDGDRTITIKGTPNLSNVRSIMVGIRNPKEPSGSGAKICGEVWFNELRLSDFDEQGGWAATAKVTAKLADLGTFSIVGYHSTAGFGSLEQKVSELNRFEKSSYDLSTTLELGKFLPEKSGIKVPTYFSYSEEIVKPLYNPLDPDVELDQALESAANAEVKDQLSKTTTEYTQKKSLNFTNVRKTKVKTGAKSHIYDVENLNFSYAYTELFNRNFNTAYSLSKTYNGSVGYNFNSSAKPIAPFEKTKSKVLSSSWLKLIKDINISPMPSALNFRATLDRSYSETQLRNNTGLLYELPATYVKTFTMQRNYGLNWDLTKSLKLDFNATANAVIDEPIGRIDTENERDSIRQNLKNLGRLKDYHHATTATYTIPFNKLPLTDFIAGSVRYGGEYNWQGRNLVYDTITQTYIDDSWGNTISNSQSLTYNATLTFNTLYGKVPFLKSIISPPVKKPAAPKPKVALPADSLKAKNDSTQKTESAFMPIIKGVVKTLMMLKTATVSYTETNGILLPGFRGKPDWLGQDWNFRGGPNAPGVGFILGSQTDPRPDAIKYHWLTEDTTLNSFYTTTTSQNLNIRAQLEPLKSFKVEVTGTRNYTLNHNEYFKYSPSQGIFESLSPTESGTFSVSYLTWNTHFVKDAKDYSNANFTQFIENIRAVSSILDGKNPNAGGNVPAPYSPGYGRTQQDVLTSAFLTAYSGRTPSGTITKKFKDIFPMPNWRVTYDGLSKLKFFSGFLQSLSITHGYRSVFSVNSFTQNLLYRETNGFPSALDSSGNFIPKYDIQQITISEQLAPLIGFDMTWKNSLQTRFEIKRDRTISLAYSNIQVTEVRGTEYTIGFGYKFKKVTLPFRIGGGKKKLSNDLNVKVDFNLRNNTTILRKVIEGTNQPSAGTTTLSIKVSADYPVNDRFNVRAFYDFNSNDPFVSTSYPTSYTNAGFAIRFTLAQ
jgi:cell surface protein SprA